MARWARRTCERCGRSILASADGGCPHCGDETSSNTTRATTCLRLSSGMRLPHVCLQCGSATHRCVRLRLVGPRQVKPPRERGAMDFVTSLIPGGCLFSLLRGASDVLDSRSPTFTLRVPQCEACGRVGKPTGTGPDYVARQLTLETHHRFADALAAKQREVERLRQGRQDGRIRS